MLMRKYQHDCKTQFVNGINPFLGLPQTGKPRARSRRVSQEAILALLADGKPRAAYEVADELDGCSSSIGATLIRMANAGLIKREMRKVPSVRPVPVYSIWST